MGTTFPLVWTAGSALALGIFILNRLPHNPTVAKISRLIVSDTYGILLAASVVFGLMLVYWAASNSRTEPNLPPQVASKPVAREAPNAGGKEDLFAKFQQKKQELYEKARADYIAKFVEGGSN